MDTSKIRATYDGLADAAAAGPHQAKDEDGWSTDRIVAHAIATNQTLNRVGIELLDGRGTTYEGGTISVKPEWLDSIIEGAGDFDGLVTYLRHSYRELLALASRFSDDLGNRKFHGATFDGRGQILVEGDMSFSDILTTYLVKHMTDHTDQVRSLQEPAFA